MFELITPRQKRLLGAARPATPIDWRRLLKPPMTAPITVITELERAIESGSPQHRAQMLLQVADLFVSNSPRYTDDEISLFDDIITRLATEIEVSVRSLLAQRLAPIANAPANIMRILASDDEIKVAYPVLLSLSGSTIPSLCKVPDQRARSTYSQFLDEKHLVK